MPRIVNTEDKTNHGSSERGHLLLSQFDMPDDGNVFAVSLEQPMFKHLQLYFVYAEAFCFWNCMGQMGENLYEGFRPAIKEAIDEGSHVYVFSKPEDVLEDIGSCQNPPQVRSYLYMVAP